MVMAQETNGSEQFIKSMDSFNSISSSDTNKINDNKQETNDSNIEQDNDSENVEVDEFGRMLRRRSAISNNSSNSEDDYKRCRRRHHNGFEERRSGNHHNCHSYSQEDFYLTGGKGIADSEFYMTKIYVGDLRDVTERELHGAFEKFGEIKKVDMLPGKGIAFIDFDTEKGATEARRRMNGCLLGSGYITVNRAIRPEKSINGYGPWNDAGYYYYRFVSLQNKSNNILTISDAIVTKQNADKPIRYNAQNQNTYNISKLNSNLL
ncbi:11978_t:CDS:2 [Entrophospora sp. SA101]|nr:11978_t:CDS:2 [Entrophospora sp. SA101]CAJ0834103.1 15603_t:CDS:2 [Entrophospora sp. SA101]